MLIVRHLYQFGISSEFLVIEPERNCVCVCVFSFCIILFLDISDNVNVNVF